MCRCVRRTWTSRSTLDRPRRIVAGSGRAGTRKSRRRRGCECALSPLCAVLTHASRQICLQPPLAATVHAQVHSPTSPVHNSPRPPGYPASSIPPHPPPPAHPAPTQPARGVPGRDHPRIVSRPLVLWLSLLHRRPQCRLHPRLRYRSPPRGSLSCLIRASPSVPLAPTPICVRSRSAFWPVAFVRIISSGSSMASRIAK